MSGIEGAADQVFSDSSRTLAPAAVGSQVALMSVISIVTILLFNFLRPKNKIIYEPKVKYHEGDKPPPRITDHLFGWLPPLANTKEPELLDKIGLDAVAFLRFNRLLRWLFTGIVVLTCGILVPINVVYNLKNVKSSGRDFLSMLTIRDVEGDFLYAHVVVTYLITILIIAAVWYHWRAMIRLRHTWFRSDEYLKSFYARTLQVTHVPRKAQTDEGLKSIFDGLGMPYPTTSVHIGRKVGDLPELIEYHNDTVREFEAILVRYMKGGKLKSKRPTMRVGATMGCCGGRKYDAIDFYTNKLKKTEQAVERLREDIDREKAKNYGFASLAAVPYAHIVAQKLEGKHPKGTTISLAPNPKDIVWKNMDKTDGEIARKRTIGVLWLVFVCFFNTIPLFVISVLANLDGIRGWVSFLDEWATKSPTSFSVVSGVLPATISSLFGFFLPIIMRWLTKFMGAPTYSSLDRAVVARYFAFLIISQLVIFTLIGVLFNSVKEIIQAIGNKASFKEIIANLDDLPDKINRTYINQASFWLTYFPLRGFLVIFDLAQIINLVWLSFKTHVFGRTPREIREWTKPPIFQYAIYYSNILFMAAVGLVFAPLAPLVAVAACVVFWLGSWVYKYQLMFVYVSRVESGGRLWNVVINRLLFCVLLMQSLMILTIGLQKGFMTFIWVSAVPPILLIVIFKIYINRVFVPAFRYFSPTPEEIAAAKVHSQGSDHRGNRLEKRFGHPSLHEELFTPSVHAEHMPLLAQIYSGKIKHDKARLGEYGGQKMEASVVPGGIKIAGIGQSDLAYDLALYRRDRGELDWDQRSMASTNMLDNASMINGHVPRGSVSKFNGYDDYLAKGPLHQQHDIELAPMDTMTEPLLHSRGPAFQQQAMESQQTLASPPSLYQYSNGSAVSRDLYRPQERSWSPSPAYQSTETLHQVGPSPTLGGYTQSPDTLQTHQYPPQHQRQPSNNVLAGYQNNRPQTPSSSGHSPQPSQQYPPNQHARQMSGNMLASGRHSPGPNQAYARAPSPGPNQAYGRAPSPGPNQAYGGRSPSPGPYQAYGRSPSPGANRAYGNTSPSSAYGQQPQQQQQQYYQNSSPQRPVVNTQVPQQQHGRSPSGNMLSAYPQQQQRGPSPVSPSGYGQHSPGRQQQQPWQR
ncbi:hypothetical protein MD484_g2683, partial [Candolleomyces efflorescens]